MELDYDGELSYQGIDNPFGAGIREDIKPLLMEPPKTEKKKYPGYSPCFSFSFSANAFLSLYLGGGWLGKVGTAIYREQPLV